MTTKPLPRIALLAVPHSTVSTLYGMYDLFASAGRDWSFVVDGRVGEPLLEPRIVARTTERFEAGNGVRIEADETLDEAGVPDVVCIPDLMVEPDAELSFVTRDLAQALPKAKIAAVVAIEDSQRSLPALTAQCLHIWNTGGKEIADFPNFGAGYQPLEEETYCAESR